MMKLSSRLIILIALFTMAEAALFGNSTIYLTNGEWPPYLSDNLHGYGFASQVVTEAFALEGVDVQYGFFPWSRSYLLAKEGMRESGQRWNGTVVWSYRDDRAEFFNYSDPVVIEKLVLFFLKDNYLEWEEIEDLEGLIIGGTQHTSYLVLEEAQSRGLLRIERLGDYTMLFNRLLEERFDAFPMEEYVGRHFINTTLTEKEKERVAINEKAVEDIRQFHLILAKDVEENDRFMELFNSGLKKLKETGRFEELHRMLRSGYFDYHPRPE